MTTISSAGTHVRRRSGNSRSRSTRSQRPASIAGWCRLRRSASICASAWPMASRVFWLPLSRAIGLTAPKACPDMSLVQELFTTTCDWKVASLGWMYTLFFVVLGVSAAIWGGWLERVGPRKAGVVAALCWCGGLLIGAFGVYVHQLWIMWLGAGVIGGVGLGLGYISPVSTLIKWFPGPPRHGDRHGHHGLRRRRHDRRAAGESPDQLLQDPDLGRRLADLRHHGRDLFRLHDDRRLSPIASRRPAGGPTAGRRRAKTRR